jgi:hypothetical protein
MITVWKVLFFKENGSGSPNFWGNLQAISKRISRLRNVKISEFQNTPLEWIEKMSQKEEKWHPNTMQLTLYVRAAGLCLDSSITVRGICCEASVHGDNDSEDDTSSGLGYDIQSPVAETSLRS